MLWLSQTLLFPVRQQSNRGTDFSATAIRFGKYPRKEAASHPKRQPLQKAPQSLKGFFKRLPKTDLHMHLPGSTPLSQIRRFLKQQGLSDAQVQEKSTIKSEYASLNDFLDTYYRTTGVIKTPAHFQQAAFKVIQECAKENVRYLELRASILNKGRPPEEIVAAIESGMRSGMAWVKAHKGYEMTTGLIVLAQRAGTPEESLKTAQLAVELSKRPNSLIVGMDLAGSETDHAVSHHASALRYAEEQGLNITVHAGEIEQSQGMSGLDSVRKALEYGADRIGHGLQAIKDELLLKRLKKKQTPIEMPTWAHVQLNSVESYAKHPLSAFLKAGLNVNLATDNRMVSDITLTQQLIDLYEHKLVTSWEQIKTLLRNGIRGAFLPKHKKQKLLKEMDAHLAAFEHNPRDRQLIQRYLGGETVLAASSNNAK
jgi:adenosine deaminase